MIHSNQRFVCMLFILIMLGSGIIAQSWAADTLNLSDQKNDYSLTKYLSIFEDAGGKLSIDDIKSAQLSGQFIENTRSDLSMGYSASAYWLRIRIDNQGTKVHRWLIQQNYTHTQTMDVYASGNNYQVQRSGTLIPKELRDLPYREIVFTTSLSNIKSQTLYIRIQSRGAISLNINLLSERAFIEKSNFITTLLGLFYGVLLIMAIYNLFFYLSFKEPSYLYLTLLLVFFGLVCALYDGYVPLLLGQNLLPITPFLMPMFLGLACIATILHRDSFLSIRGNTPYVNGIHHSLLVALILVVSLTPFINFVFIMNAIFLLILLTVIHVITTTTISWRQQESAAKYAIVGWVIFGSCLFLVSLARLHVLPDHFIFEQLARVGLIVLVLLLSIALINQIIQLKLSRDKSHAALLGSEMQRDLALDAGHLGIWRWQIETDQIDWSKRACQIFGVPTDKVPRGFSEYQAFIHCDDVKKVEEIVEAAIDQQQPYSLQHRIHRADGQLAWVQCYGKIEFDKNNALLGIVGTVQDITEQKQLEIDKQQSQQLYEDIFSSATEGFVIRDFAGNTLEANPAIYQLFGYTKKEFFALNLEKLIHPDSQNEFERYQKAINNNQAYYGEVKRIHKNGHALYVEIRTCLINYRGKPHVFAIMHNIAKRKKIENTIKQIAKGVTSTDKAFFQQLILQLVKLFDARYAFIALIDDENTKKLKTFIHCIDNKIVDNISYDLDNTPCKETIDFQMCSYPDKLQQIFSKNKLLKKLNAVSYIGSPLYDIQGNSSGVIAIMDTKPMNNIEYILEIMQIFAARVGAELDKAQAQKELKTQQNYLEASVKARTAELEAVNYELESFSYSVSHDLRSPLRAIDGFSKALINDYQDKLGEEGNALLARVRSNTVRMSKLINDLLNLSRLGRTKLSFKQVNLGNIANDIIQNLRESDPLRHVEFNSSINDIVTVDAELIRIAMDNLLNNAWKYSSKNKCTIIEFGKTINHGTITYFIRDNGVGFDITYVDRLFGAFQRLHGTEFEGSGIGLATVQRIFHRHHGSVWASGKINQGATFFFTFGQHQGESVLTLS